MFQALFKNPEFKRNALIELRPNRVISLISLISFVLLLFVAINQYSPVDETVANTAAVLFYLITGVWGSKNAADAVAEEINQKTWDRQRMSGQKPWSLAIGKIFGPNILQWFGGLFAMLFYFIAALYSKNPAHNFLLGLLHISFALLCNLAALLFSLLSITGSSQSAYSHSKVNTTLYFILALVSVGYLNLYTFGIGNEEGAVQWFGMNWNEVTIFLSMLIFIIWAVIGIHQNMRKELQYLNKPTYWLVFLLFVVCYFAGFTFNQVIWNPETYDDFRLIAPNIQGFEIIYYHLLLVTFILFFITQFLLLFERQAENDYTIFRRALRRGELKLSWQKAPLWLSAFLFLTAGLLILFGLRFLGWSAHKAPILLWGELDIIDAKGQYIWNYIAIIGLVLRDIWVSRTLLYTSTFRFKLISIAVYYALVYFALPIICDIKDNTSGLLTFLWPFDGSTNWLAAVVIGFQAIAAWFWHKSSFKV